MARSLPLTRTPAVKICVQLPLRVRLVEADARGGVAFEGGVAKDVQDLVVVEVFGGGAAVATDDGDRAGTGGRWR